MNDMIGYSSACGGRFILLMYACVYLCVCVCAYMNLKRLQGGIGFMESLETVSLQARVSVTKLWSSERSGNALTHLRECWEPGTQCTNAQDCGLFQTTSAPVCVQSQHSGSEPGPRTAGLMLYN